MANREQEIMDEFYEREEEIDHLSAVREIARALVVTEDERNRLLGLLAEHVADLDPTLTCEQYPGSLGARTFAALGDESCS